MARLVWVHDGWRRDSAFRRARFGNYGLDILIWREARSEHVNRRERILMVIDARGGDVPPRP